MFRKNERMPGNKYPGNSNQIPGRVERLLRERELRKSGRVIQLKEVNEVNGSSGEAFEKEKARLREEVSDADDGVEGSRVRKGVGEERHETKPFRQRLLVVANRLPVSAVRKGEDAWSLEISAGGLVSALLGKWLSP